jgi:chromosome segregation ATPase
MSKFHDAADVLKREAVRYRALMQAAEALEEVGSLDQAASEAAARKAQIEKQLAALVEKIGASQREAERINADLAEKVVEAEAHKAALIQQSNSAAAEIVATAERRATSIVESGQAQASQELARMAEKVAAMQATLETLTDQGNAAIVRRDQAEAAATEAEAKLSRVQAQIRKLAEA